MFDEGTGKVKARKKEKIDYVVWNGKFGYFDAEGGFHDMSDVANPNLPDSAYLGRYKYVDEPVKKSKQSGVHTSNELNFNTSRHTKDGVNDRIVKKVDKSRTTPIQDEINAFYGYDRENVVETSSKDRSERINSKNRKYIVDDKDLDGGELSELVVTAPRKGKSSKSQINKNTNAKSTKTTQPVTIDSAKLNNLMPGKDYQTPVFNSDYKFSKAGNYVPIIKMDIDPTETVDELPLLGVTDNSFSHGNSGSNWKDNLYRMAVLSQPLWDRAKAESVDHASPVYKYMPTQIDVSSQLRDTDQSYALSRYNFANLYPNTGAGMAAGLQAASNRAKQYADIRQWQTNAQNELIGKNVGIYNNWANEHARILNDVYNKSAQNRAAARNINRQNRATALNNYGQMLSDDKKMAMERMKFNILKPAIRSTYEDATANDLINMYNSLFG